MLSLHTGYDTAYLTDAVGNGTAATDYYTAAAGEPPGYWQGAGARALGLAGQVDAEVMRRLYHEDVGPDGQVLARRQRKANYPAGSGSLYERIEAEVGDELLGGVEASDVCDGVSVDVAAKDPSRRTLPLAAVKAGQNCLYAAHKGDPGSCRQMFA